MKGILFVCLCICSIFPVVLGLDPNWRLVFSDEFEGNAINITKWNVRNQAGNWGNGEQQWYSPSAVTVSGGNLVITATNTPTGGKAYTSGWVDTQSRFYNTYGRYEFRAQMASGNGMWPAIWLLSNQLCWPWGAEFDIMEYRGAYPNDANGYYHYGTSCGGGHSSTGGTYSYPSSLSQGFHVYALEWFPDKVIWYIDDIAFHTFYRTDMAQGYTQFDPTTHYIIINSAIGSGGYAGAPDSNTIFPNHLLIDYVRVYNYGTSCAGNWCSGNGCCESNTTTCVCNAGWSGSSCEQWTGSLANTFVSTNVQYTPATDVAVNGWGNGYTFYSDTNVNIDHGLTLTLTNNNCPVNCGGLSYSSGAWNSALFYPYGTYSFIAQGPSVRGTGFSLGAGATGDLGLEQIAFVLTGASRNSVDLLTWHTGYQWKQTTIQLAFDHSTDYHNYTFGYYSTFVEFYIDTRLVYNASEVIPSGTLQLGAYYTAQPDWYGGPFTYTGPSTTKISQASFNIKPSTAVCSPAPVCQAYPVGTGAGLTGDYYDGDSGSSWFMNYKQTIVDPQLNFNWGEGAPANGVNADYFSVRWTGQVQPLYSNAYTFYTTTDDGVRVWVNNVLVVDAWYDQAPNEHSSSAITLQAGKFYDIVVEYEETGGGATQVLSWSSQCQPKQVIPQSQLYPCRSPQNANGNGLNAQYYSDQNLGSLAHTQIDSNINMYWGSGGPSALNGRVDQFSVQWSGFVQPRYSGLYTFYASSDDGSRLYVNGQLLVDKWVDKGNSEFSGSISLLAGQKYSVLYQYYENGGGAEAYMSWSSSCQPKEIIPQSQLFSS